MTAIVQIRIFPPVSVELEAEDVLLVDRPRNDFAAEIMVFVAGEGVDEYVGIDEVDPHRTQERTIIVHSGLVILEDFLLPLGNTQKEAAERLRVSYPMMNEIVKGKQTVTPDTALRLSRFTGTEPEFWLNLQQAVDLWDAMHSEQSEELEEIKAAQVA